MSWPPTLLPASAKPFDVVAFGENSLDFVGIGPRPLDGADKTMLTAFDVHVGGQAATAAVTCARQGHRTRYVGSFGDDDWGHTVKAALARDEIDVVSIERAAAKSRVAIVHVDSESGCRTVFGFRDPLLATDPATAPREQLLSGRVLMLDATDVKTSAAIARLARQAGIRTLVDVDRMEPAVGHLLAHIDVIVVSESFLIDWMPRASRGEALSALATEFRPAAAVVTLGAEGSLALACGQEIRTPAFVVDVADTTGAGDAFRGGFASAWLRMAHGPDLTQILELANATAALNCQAVGAQTGLPRLAEVEALVTRARRRQSK
jgi:sugar/nucleoside kinase (ribokinase family)